MKFISYHLVEIESVINELNALDLTVQQKTHLADLLDSCLQHAILDAMLSKLALSDKKIFLYYLATNQQDRIWPFLNEKISNIEKEIAKAAGQLKDEMHQDLQEARNK